MDIRSFVNMTPHPISYEGEDGKRVTIQPSGILPRVETIETPVEIPGVKLVTQRTGKVIGLPPVGQFCPRCGGFTDGEGCRDCLGDTAPTVKLPNGTLVFYPVFVVSRMVLDAMGQPPAPMVAPDTGKTAIRDEKGRIQAVRQFVIHPACI